MKEIGRKFLDVEEARAVSQMHNISTKHMVASLVISLFPTLDVLSGTEFSFDADDKAKLRFEGNKSSEYKFARFPQTDNLIPINSTCLPLNDKPLPFNHNSTPENRNSPRNNGKGTPHKSNRLPHNDNAVPDNSNEFPCYFSEDAGEPTS